MNNTIKSNKFLLQAVPVGSELRLRTTSKIYILRNKHPIWLQNREDSEDWIKLDDSIELMYYFELLWEAPSSSVELTKQSNGIKYDSEKPRMDLLFSDFPNALEVISSVLTFGATKYNTHNWKNVTNGDERYLAALLRHITAFHKGEENDPETGLHHLAHAACNALFILELALNRAKKI